MKNNMHQTNTNLVSPQRSLLSVFIITTGRYTCSEAVGYGCSFVAKLSRKKIFQKKIFVFLTKYTLFAEKKCFYIGKKIILKIFFSEKKLFLQLFLQ